jgi:hypothetical protein
LEGCHNELKKQMECICRMFWGQYLDGGNVSWSGAPRFMLLNN